MSHLVTLVVLVVSTCKIFKSGSRFKIGFIVAVISSTVPPLSNHISTLCLFVVSRSSLMRILLNLHYCNCPFWTFCTGILFIGIALLFISFWNLGSTFFWVSCWRHFIGIGCTSYLFLYKYHLAGRFWMQYFCRCQTWSWNVRLLVQFH